MIFVGPKAPKARPLEMSTAVVRRNGRAFSPKVCRSIKPSPLGCPLGQENCWAVGAVGPKNENTATSKLARCACIVSSELFFDTDRGHFGFADDAFGDEVVLLVRQHVNLGDQHCMYLECLSG